MPRVLRNGVLFLLLAAVPGAAGTAQTPVPTDPERTVGISVIGTGEVWARPNLVEIDLGISGSAELAGDAIVKIRDAKKRALAAFAALGLEKLDIQERGIALASSSAANAQQMMWGGQPPAAKPQITIARTLRLLLRDVQDTREEELMETLGKLLDTAKDSGASVGPSPEAAAMAWRYGQPVSGTVARFILDQFAEHRENAYRKAVDDARGRAVRLAALHGVRLGSVSSVQELQVSGEDAPPVPQPYYVYPGANTQADAQAPRITSDRFADIPIRVRLQVRFHIAGPELDTGEE